MCSTPKMPQAEKTETATVAVPTAADAAVSKASTSTRNKTGSLASRTSARGLLDEATTRKKGLLGE